MTSKQIAELVARLDALADWHAETARFIVPDPRDATIHFHLAARDDIRTATRQMIETFR